MKVKFVCDSGANIHSARTEVVDTEVVDTEDYGYTDEEWLELSEEQKQEIVEEWANERLQVYFDEENLKGKWD